MATVLDALAPYVKQMITDMAKQEVCMLLGVSGEIKKLESNVGKLEAYVADAERRRIDSKQVQLCVNKLKHAMYQATDILELCQLEGEERRVSMSCWTIMEEKSPGFLRPLLFFLRNPCFAHRMGNRIKALNASLNEIRNEMVEFRFEPLNSYQVRIAPSDVGPPSHKETSLLEKTAVVGEQIERDTKALVQELLTTEPWVKVVSIVGAGGMGKSTLAKNIVNDEAVQLEFKGKIIWLSITESYNEEKLLSSAIDQAGGEPRGDKQTLTRTLARILSTDKFLVAMDDVWSNRPWTDVLRDPVIYAASNQPGSRVIITTRNEDLVKQMGAAYYLHHVKPMCDEDAWLLLKKQLLGQVVDHLTDVGMRIIEKCGGLPLAIKLMGGLLSTRYPNQRDWEDVLNNPAWSVDGLRVELDNRIYLSYADLTPQLKQCFLYCSLFPKGTSFWMSQATPMWISEGFIQPPEGSSSHGDQLEEVANKYFRELITRNLIEPTRNTYQTGYECTMHDLIRSFALFMARDELLVVHGGQASASSNDSFVRYISIGPTDSVPEWAVLLKHESLRTLILNCRINLTPRDSLSSFSSLRVLYMKYADYDHLVEAICQLRHLRYLKLEETNVSKLPDDIHRMKFLQHIVLFSCSNLGDLPSSITELVGLRTLDIEHSNVKVVPKRFGGLTNLRILKGFPVCMDMDGGWCSLEEIAPLSQLRNLVVGCLENVCTSSLAEKAMISSKRHLSYLRLNCSSSVSIGLGDDIEHKQQLIEEVFDRLCPPICIENLGMKRYFGRRLPNWMSVQATTAFRSLRYLQFEELTSCIKLPDGLCKLPCLEGLVIKSAPRIKRVGPEFQAFSSLVVGGGETATSAAFPMLRTLWLEGLSEWEEWEWEEHGKAKAEYTIAMPNLETLYIENCKLSCLPPGLANSERHALRELYLHEIANLTSVENLPSVVILEVSHCSKLKRICGLSRLQNISIVHCPNVDVLKGVPVLDSIELKDTTMETLPGYVQRVNPRYLELGCCRELYESILLRGSLEGNKISHIKKQNIYVVHRTTTVILVAS